MYKRSFFIVGVAVIASFFGRGWIGERENPSAAAIGVEHASIVPFQHGVPPFAPDQPQAQVTEGKISRGESFFVEMTRAGIAPEQVHRIVQASKPTFNFRKVRPGQAFSIFSTERTGLDSLHFVVDTETILKICKKGDTFDTRLETIPHEVEHFVTSGTIDNSIYRTLQEGGSNPELASYLANIFQWDIDFFKDIRRGDTFTILYEKKIYPDGRSQLGNVLSAKVVTQGREHFAIAYDNGDGYRYYDASGKSLQKSLLRAPLRYSRVSSSFSYRRRHPVTHQYKPHLGIDYAAPTGTPVYATGDGKVIAAAYNRGNGNYVKIRHNSQLTTYYLHFSRFAKGVRKGRYVKQGQVIGYVGATGIATGPHLDYRIKQGNRFVNPRTIRLPSMKPIADDEMARFQVLRDSYLVRMFDAPRNGETVQVATPRPPIQELRSRAF